jgi:hypothetical protein
VEETGEPGENLSQVTDKIDHISKVQSIKLFAPCGTLKVQREQ